MKEEKYEPYTDARHNVFDVMTHMIWGDSIDKISPQKKETLFNVHFSNYTKNVIF